MAEIDVGGVKMSGSKMMFILPLLGTLIGGLWGGFELYSRLLEAEETLANLQPEAIQAEMTRLTELTEIIKTDLRADINIAVDLARATDKTSADTQREIRNDVYAMEKEMQGRFREMDKDIRDNKRELEEKIVTILENPLNDTE
jgi:gas vesicle protein